MYVIFLFIEKNTFFFTFANRKPKVLYTTSIILPNILEHVGCRCRLQQSTVATSLPRSPQCGATSIVQRLLVSLDSETAIDSDVQREGANVCARAVMLQLSRAKAQ